MFVIYDNYIPLYLYKYKESADFAFLASKVPIILYLRVGTFFTYIIRVLELRNIDYFIVYVVNLFLILSIECFYYLWMIIVLEMHLFLCYFLFYPPLYIYI